MRIVSNIGYKKKEKVERISDLQPDHTWLTKLEGETEDRRIISFRVQADGSEIRVEMSADEAMLFAGRIIDEARCYHLANRDQI